MWFTESYNVYEWHRVHIRIRTFIVYGHMGAELTVGIARIRTAVQRHIHCSVMYVGEGTLPWAIFRFGIFLNYLFIAEIWKNKNNGLDKW